MFFINILSEWKTVVVIRWWFCFEESPTTYHSLCLRVCKSEQRRFKSSWRVALAISTATGLVLGEGNASKNTKELHQSRNLRWNASEANAQCFNCYLLFLSKWKHERLPQIFPQKKTSPIFNDSDGWLRNLGTWFELWCTIGGQQLQSWTQVPWKKCENLWDVGGWLCYVSVIQFMVNIHDTGDVAIAVSCTEFLLGGVVVGNLAIHE